MEYQFRAYNRIVNRFQFFTLQEIENQKGTIQWQNLDIDLFTGLIDENGEKLFSGDIVEAIFNHEGKKSEISFNAKIIYNSNIGSFQISYLNGRDKFVNDTIWNRFFLRKIGNIYENYDLLGI